MQYQANVTVEHTNTIYPAQSPDLPWLYQNDKNVLNTAEDAAPCTFVVPNIT